MFMETAIWRLSILDPRPYHVRRELTADHVQRAQRDVLRDGDPVAARRRRFQQLARQHARVSV